jgi:hypothetical protein
MKTYLIFSFLLSVVQFFSVVQAAYKVSGFTFNSKLTSPYGIWKDPNDGILYICEPTKHRIMRVDGQQTTFLHLLELGSLDLMEMAIFSLHSFPALEVSGRWKISLLL